MLHKPVVTTFVLAVAQAAAAWTTPPDLRALTPEPFLGREVAALERQALDAREAGRWDAAARSYLEVVRRKPGDAGSLYNLGCCLARLGLERQAAEFVAAAWAAGYRDLLRITSDPDFAAVRSGEEFSSLLRVLQADVARRERQAGRLITFSAPIAMTARLLAPATEPGDVPLPLLVVLHGAGGSGDLAGAFKASGVRQPFVVCAPTAPYWDPAVTDGPVWFPGDRAADHSLAVRLAEDAVLRAIDEACAAARIDRTRVFVLGFSQGGTLAYSLALRHPERFSKAVVVAGLLDMDELDAAQIEAARGKVRFLLAHSPEDRSVPIQRCEEAARMLRHHGTAVEVFHYTGGHDLTRDVLLRATAFLEPGDAAAPAP